MIEKITNLIFAICMIIVATGVIILIIKLTTDSPVYISTYEKDGQTYILSNANIQEVKK